MDLEVRIEALEAEVKILKNEIQGILLEIQEQVLLHYYPSLRVEDGEPSEAVLQALDAIRERKTTVNASSEPVSPEEETTPVFSVPDAEAELPAPSFEGDDTGKPTSRPSLVPPFMDRAQGDAGGEADEWDTFGEMVAWVRESASSMGPERTRKVIEVYVEGDLLSSQMADALLQVLTAVA